MVTNPYQIHTEIQTQTPSIYQVQDEPSPAYLKLLNDLKQSVQEFKAWKLAHPNNGTMTVLLNAAKQQSLIDVIQPIVHWVELNLYAYYVIKIKRVTQRRPRFNRGHTS